jgi:hypothetical protein
MAKLSVTVASARRINMKLLPSFTPLRTTEREGQNTVSVVLSNNIGATSAVQAILDGGGDGLVQ